MTRVAQAAARTRRRRVTVVTALAAVVAVLIAGCGMGGGSVARFAFVSPGGVTDFFYPPQERQTIDDLSGPDVRADRTIALSDYAGKVVVINVWGSWCAPCRAEAPDLQQVAAATADQGVQFLGINVRDNRQAASDFIDGFGLSYPSIFDPPLRTLTSIRGFPTGSIPSTIILDGNRQVAAIYLRAVTARELQATIDAVVAGSVTPATSSGPLPVPTS